MDPVIDSPLKDVLDAEPAFELLDDCGGRFVVDGETGVIGLAHDGWLTRELGAEHEAVLRVRELDGSKYDVTLKLRLTGMVPQVSTMLDAFDAPEAVLRPARVAMPDMTRFCACAAPIAPPEADAPFILAAPAYTPLPASAAWSL